jgi:hypothetical protein
MDAPILTREELWDSYLEAVACLARQAKCIRGAEVDRAKARLRQAMVELLNNLTTSDRPIS